MTSRFGSLAALGLLLAAGCRAGDDLAVPDDLVAPAKVVVTPLNLRAVRIQWNAVPAAQSYRLERRANLNGEFVVVAPSLPQSLPGPVVYIDNTVEPETFYGYRIFALDRLGNQSDVSAVGGARTPALPSLDVQTVPVQDGASLVEDPDGYTVVVAGPDTIRRAFATRATERIGPLRVGSYQVRLDGVANNCRPAASPIPVAISDTGTNTVSSVTFLVTCRDPSRGEIVVAASVTGEPPVGARFRVDVTGVASDQSLPPTQRAFAETIRLSENGTPVRLRDLRPGDYQVEVDSIPTSCTVSGNTRRSVDVTPLSSDTVRYEIACGSGGGGNTSGRPYIYRNRWAPKTVASGGTAELRLSLDLSATATAAAGAVEGTLRYDQQALRFERIEALDSRFNVVGNGSIPGTVSWGGFTTTAGATGDVPIAKMVFTVLGPNGGRVITRTTDVRATFFDFTPIDTLVRVTEDTLSIGSGQGANQPPVAEANGPYGASVGAAITFSSTGSADPDGSIQSYTWDFGDGSTSTQANPTKSYATAGSYTARLTVTDNGGATASDQATVTVTPVNSSTPPTWKATFGALDPVTSTVPLVISYDLTGDVAATPGAEAIAAWVVDSLKWNPAVLRFFAFSFGSGGSGTVNTSGALAGRLRFQGTQAPSSSTGIVTIATIRFKVVGSGGQQTTTATSLGSITGTAATGSFEYRPVTQLVEGSYTVAGGGGGPTGGTVSGTVTRSTGGAVAGATVTVAPGGSASTNGSGQYSVSNVAVGSGTVTVSNVPSGCTAPTAKPYTIAANGATVTVDFTVTCATGGTTGTLVGTVSRSTGGGISGATVTATPGGSATTAGTGQYTIGNVAVGSGTVAVSGLPTGCTAPAAKPYTVASAGQNVTVDFSVTCTATGTGTVTGTVKRAGAGGTAIAGASVSVTPGGSATTNASGQYTVAAVPVGGGTVSVGALPSGCTAPATKPYTIASAGQTVDVSFEVTCAAPSGNALAGKWTVSGTTATLEVRASMVSGNLAVLEASFAPGSSRLQYTGSSAATAPAMPNTFATSPPATTIAFGALTTASGGLTGDVGIIKLTFTILAGAPTTVTGTLSGVAAQNASFADVSGTFTGRISVDPLTLP